MEYMLILAAAPEAWADDEHGDHDGRDVDDGVIDDWALYTRALHEAGVLVAGHGLQGTDVTTTVRVRGGERILTDGPFTDTKEHLIGYYVIETTDLDSALIWASRAPNARIGSVEVRPIMADSSTDRMLAAGAADE